MFVPMSTARCKGQEIMSRPPAVFLSWLTSIYTPTISTRSLRVAYGPLEARVNPSGDPHTVVVRGAAIS